MSGWKEIVAVPRHTVRRMKATIRGSVIKVLTEFITNCDDSYYRLEKSGESPCGVIQIGYWQGQKHKHVAIKDFYVRDYAEGIPPETVEQKFGKYGEDTAGRTRRGYFGQGAKDALCNMKNSRILSVNNGNVISCQFKIENEVPKYLNEDGKVSLRTLEGFNEKIEGVRKLNSRENGTFAYFEIPPDKNAPRVKTLVESLQTFYMLRKILSDPKRKVQLIDNDTIEVTELKYIPPSGKLMLSDAFTISHDSLKFDVAMTVSEADRDINQRQNEKREGGLLIVDEDDAVLDLTLFGYDEESSAARLFGEVRIMGFKQLFHEDPTVITETREGLDYSHPFNRLLREEVRKRLGKIVEQLSKEKSVKDIILDKRLDTQIKKAFAKINALMKQEADAGLEEGSGEVEKTRKVPESGLAFSPSVISIESGRIKTVHLVVDPTKIPPKSTIFISCDNSKIEVVPTGTIEVPEDIFSERVLQIPINILGEQHGEKGVITASFLTLQANLFVTIAEIREVNPPSGFGFVPDRIRMYEGKKTKLKLMIDTLVIRPSILVGIDSDNPDIRIASAWIGSQVIENISLFPLPRPESGTWIIVLVEIEGLKAGQKGRIKARALDKEAIAEVRVVEKRPPGGLFKDYKLDPKKDPRQRVSFDKKSGMIFVHSKAPVLQQYFGPEAEYLKKERSPQAVVLLAETILRCICLQWAKYRYENGVKEYLNPEDPAAKQEEEESEARQIDYQYGMQIHEWIVGEYREGIVPNHSVNSAVS